MITLTAMKATDYNNYLAMAISDYAEDKIKSGAWKKEDALQLSKQTFLTNLPKQQETENQFLYCITLDQTTIGYCWFHFNPEESDTAFIYDFLILDTYQNRGYGTKTLALIENSARNAGAKKLALHVFAHNERAIHVYQNTGFHFTDYSMAKNL